MPLETWDCKKKKKVCLTVNGFPGHSPITIIVMKCNYSSTIHPGNRKYTMASKHFLEPEVKSHLKIAIVLSFKTALLEKLVHWATRFDIVRSWYICICEIKKTSSETNKAIFYVLDGSHTVGCIVCLCTREYSYVLCFFMGGINRSKQVSSCGCSAQNATLATPCSTGFSSWLILCAGLLLLYMIFKGSQIKLGVLFWNVVFRHFRDNGSDCFASTIQTAKDLKFNVFLYFTLCACVSFCTL